MLMCALIDDDDDGVQTALATPTRCCCCCCCTNTNALDDDDDDDDDEDATARLSVWTAFDGGPVRPFFAAKVAKHRRALFGKRRKEGKCDARDVKHRTRKKALLYGSHYNNNSYYTDQPL